MRQFRLLCLVLIAFAVAACKSEYEKGQQAYQQGKWKEAIEHFSKVKGWDDNSDQAENMIGKACFNIGKEALQAGQWDEALKYLPKSGAENYSEAKELMAQARFGRGKEAMARKDYSSALNDFLLVTPESPNYQEARQLITQVKKLKGS